MPKRPVPLFGLALVLVCAVSLRAQDDDTRTPVSVPFKAVSTDSKDIERDVEETPPDHESPKAADVIDLPPPPKKVPDAPANVAENHPPPDIDTGLDEDAVKARQNYYKEREKERAKELEAPPAAKPPPRAAPEQPKTAPKPLENVQPVVPDTQINLPPKPVTEPGYASVLTGTLQANTELHAETLPHLIRGILIVPAKFTLKIEAGAIVHLRADAGAAKPLQPGAPDPSKSAAVWIYGTLIVTGENGRPVEFVGQDKDNANLLFYGAERSKLEAARFKGSDVAQNGGVVQWTNCEFNDSKYYALAAGASLFTHCSFKKCGGIFAAYDEGPWALLARRCLFENCRDGLLLNRDPGLACLLVEKNNFIGTRGANLRAMPRLGATASKTAEEVLIGENWYGTNIEEDIDRRIVDRRTDPAIKAHLNTRPPSEKPYANTGAGAPQATITATLQDEQKAIAKMLDALAARQKSVAKKP